MRSVKATAGSDPFKSKAGSGPSETSELTWGLTPARSRGLTPWFLNTKRIE